MMKKPSLTLAAAAVLAAVALSGCGQANHLSTNASSNLYYNFDYALPYDHFFTWFESGGKIVYYAHNDLIKTEKTFTSWAVDNEKMFIHSWAPWATKYTKRAVPPGFVRFEDDNSRAMVKITDFRRYENDPDLPTNKVRILNREGRKDVVKVAFNLTNALSNMNVFEFMAMNPTTGQLERHRVENKDVIAIEFDDIASK